MTRKILRSAILLVIALGGASLALAQSYPSRPVRIVVPFAVGGNSDRIARALSDSLGKTFNQHFVVENRPGAGGAIGVDIVGKSTPDGYTLLKCTVGQFAILPHLQKLGYNPLKDFAPISNLGSNSLVVSVHGSVPAKTFREFVDYVKANPGKVSYGSAGNGSFSHFSTAMFVARAGLNMIHVPYKGGPLATQDLIAGQLNTYFGNAPDLVPHAKTGRIVLLAVTSEKRDRALPDLPAIAELYPGFSTVSWNGLMAPAGTPKEIIDRLAREVQKALREPAMIARFEQMGIDAIGSTPGELAELMRRDFARYGEAVKTAGIRAE